MYCYCLNDDSSVCPFSLLSKHNSFQGSAVTSSKRLQLRNDTIIYTYNSLVSVSAMNLYHGITVQCEEPIVSFRYTYLETWMLLHVYCCVLMLKKVATRFISLFHVIVTIKFKFWTARKKQDGLLFFILEW